MPCAAEAAALVPILRCEFWGGWHERFPVRETALAMETPPARQVLAESRTLRGSGAAGVATMAAAGIEVAQNVLAETQSAITRALPRHFARGVHSRGARGHRGRDLRPH